MLFLLFFIPTLHVMDLPLVDTHWWRGAGGDTKIRWII